MATLTTLQTRLSEAETALHEALVTGRGIVRYRDAAGVFVEKAVGDLRAYVAELRQQVAARSGSRRTVARLVRP